MNSPAGSAARRAHPVLQGSPRGISDPAQGRGQQIPDRRDAAFRAASLVPPEDPIEGHQTPPRRGRCLTKSASVNVARAPSVIGRAAI
jgi:hypothetical protein